MSKKCLFFFAIIVCSLLSVISQDAFVINAEDNEFRAVAVNDVFITQDADTVVEQINNASQGDKIYLRSEMVISEPVTIPVGVEVIIPIDDTVTDKSAYYKETGAVTNDFAWSQPGTYKRRTVTFNDSLTILGKLYVGGTMFIKSQPAMQGHTSGDYAELIINGDVTIGGTMDVYGLVSGDGGITVNDGGTLIHPFVVLDFMGGTITQALYNSNEVPFNRFVMPNIQCEKGYKISYGGSMQAHVQLYANSQYNTDTVTLIANENAMFNLSEGASVTVTYDPDAEKVNTVAANNTKPIGRTKMIFEGGASMAFMSIKVKIFAIFAVTVKTDNVYFPIPYNYDVELKEGDFTIQYLLRVMPGATLTVDENAVLNVSKGLQVYDELDQPTAMGSRHYPTPTELMTGNYPVHANLIVNGTLKIADGATMLGAVQTSGSSGKIEVGEATLSGTMIYGGVSGNNNNKVETQSSARVYDDPHKTIAELSAGHNYTADGDVIWSGNKDDMQGCFMIEHDVDTFDFNKVEEGDNRATKDTPVVEVTHLCTQLGCRSTQQKNALYVPADLAVPYTGVEYNSQNIADALYDQLGEEQSYFDKITLTVDTPAVNVGTFDVTFALNNKDSDLWQEAEVYTSQDRTVKVTILPHDIAENVTADIKSLPFKGTAYTVGEITPLIKAKFLEFDMSSTTDYDVSITGNATDVGSVTVVLTGKNNFTGTKEVTFSIEPATEDAVSVKVTGAFTYNGTQQRPNINNGLTISSTLQGQSFGLSETDYTLSYSNNVQAGTGHVTVDLKGNYSGSKTVDFTIARAQIKLNLIEQKTTYNGQAQSPRSNMYTVQGVIEGDDVKFTLGSDNAINAGRYPISVQMSGEKAENYTLSYDEANTLFVIERMPVKGSGAGSVTVNGTYTYSGREIQPTDIVVTVKVGQETQSVSKEGYNLSYTSNVHAGSGTVTVTFNELSNFSGSIDGTFTIGKADITVTAHTVTVPENGEFVQPSFSITGNLFESDRETLESHIRTTVKDYSPTAKKGEKFTVEASYIDGYTNDDYSVNFVNGEYIITDSVFKDVSVKPTSAVYDGQAHMPEVTGLTDKMQIAYEFKLDDLPKDSAIDVGNYSVKVTITSVEDDITSKLEVTAALEISPKTVTVEIPKQSAEYNGSLQTLTTQSLSVEGIEERDSVTAQLEIGSAAVKVGDYSVKATLVGDGADNYNLNATGGENAFSISPKEIGITLVRQQKTYTGSVINAGGEASNYLLDEEFYEFDEVYVALSGSGTDVGEYEVKASLGGRDAGNYTLLITGENNVLIIEPLDITDDYTMSIDGTYVYSGKSQKPTYENITLSSHGLSVTFSEISYGDNIDVGKGDVTVTANGNFSGNASAQFDIIQRNISDATVTVIGSYVYTGEDIAPSVTILLDDFVFESKDYDLGYAHNREAGEATVTVSGKGNFAGTAEGRFVISEAPIVISFAGATSVYGDTPHDIVLSASGIREADASLKISDYVMKKVMSGEEETSLSEKSNAGLYNIAVTFEGRPKNYQFIVGDLAPYVISKRVVGVDILNQNGVYGFNKKYAIDQNAWRLSENSSLVNDDEKDDLSIMLIGAADGADAGEHEITGVADSINYEVVFNSGTFTIDKLDIGDITLIAGRNQPKDGRMELLFEGPITVTGSAAIQEGEEIRELAVKIVHDDVMADSFTIDKLGEYSLTLTVDDKNYTGSKTFIVSAIDPRGYTQNILDVLAALKRSSEKVDKDDLVADNFQYIYEMYSQIEKLSDREKKLAQQDLSEYEEYIQLWNRLVGIDENIIKTAVAVSEGALRLSEV